ncbi:hypothetical protein B7P43_G16063 [Cryptotermes secundus]|uniref:Nuclear respiratory factor 1 NLS/DNA-binding dimerisation domain-containing protein n=1 Tax=Cryptotermes secundus TaxID=105785 RepID=A0A2J7PTL0_9NEOP|nr:hypothetical protein B7P43_G16063 [Cryptotermes secundus]
MTDESPLLISLVKLQVRKLKLGGFNLSGISDEEIMISNLPLLFADGYPTCLEKFTLAQLERFVPFMLQCSLGQKYLDKYTSTPKWWPTDLPFSVCVKKPVGMDDTRWFATLKSMVCRCYTYHGCEFMLRFCTELSKCPSTTYEFVESLDGTTSLYSKETGRLMVTFRNENREYDKGVESNPRRFLVRRNCSQNTSHILLQPPVFDIYLCDNCDGEFDSLPEVQEHEKTCGKQQISQEMIPEEQPKQQSQDSFLLYFNLKSVNSENVPRAVSPLKKNSCKRRYRVGVRFSRCSAVPFSSPLGILIQRKSRMAPINSQVLLERLERYCITNVEGASSRFREREFEDKMQEAIEWPVTWKPPHQKKAQDIWTHHYCFTVKESHEKIARIASGGLSKRSQKLLSMCRDVRVVMMRLTEEEIVGLTTRMPTPDPSPRDSEAAFQLPTLIPNTMYAYNAYLNVKNHYPEPIALSPQSTIPVIDLCSTDEEDEVEPITSVPLLSDENSPLVLAEEKYQEQNGVEDVEPVFCNKTSSPSMAVYPVIETPYETYAQVRRSSSCLDKGTFATRDPSDPSLRFSESVSQGWQMNICMKTPISTSPAPAFTNEEKHITYSSALRFNSAEVPVPNLASSERKRRLQTKNFNMISASETFGGDEVEEVHTPFLQRDKADYFKFYNPYVPLIRTRIDSETKARVSVPSYVSAPLTIDCTDTEKSNSKLSFPCRKEEMEVSVEDATSNSPSFISEADSSKSLHSVSSLNHRKEQTLTKVCCMSSEESSRHNARDAYLSSYEETGKHHTSMLKMIPNTSSPVLTRGKSTSLDETVNTSVSDHLMPTRPRRRVRYQRKMSSTTPSSPSIARNLHTDGDVASYASLQSNQTDSVKMHRSKISVPLRKEQSQSKVVITPLPATALTFSEEGDGTAYAPLHCDMEDDPKLQHSNPSLPHRRDRTRYAMKRASEAPQHMGDPDSVVPTPKKPNLKVYRETVPGLESKTQDELDKCEPPSSRWRKGLLSYCCASSAPQASPDVLLGCNLHILKNRAGFVL